MCKFQSPFFALWHEPLLREGVKPNMASTFENELVEIYEQEIDKLVSTESKYASILGASEVFAVVRAFRFALEHGVEKVTVQMLYDMIDDRSGE
mgnify:CR=1 FL=1